MKTNKILELRNRIKKIKKTKSSDLKQIIYNLLGSCRFKNGAINYSKLGREIGTTHHTAKKWCIDLQLYPNLLLHLALEILR
jgi:hypothetical protein